MFSEAPAATPTDRMPSAIADKTWVPVASVSSVLYPVTTFATVDVVAAMAFGSCDTAVTL